MTTARFGWYVHHHGHGHVSRLLAVRPHVPGEVVVFSSLPAPASLPPATEWVRLPEDDALEEHDGRVLDPHSAEPTANGRFHWAPHAHRGHRRRLAIIAARAEGLDAFVVDVSAEVAAFVRLLGLPLVLFTQPGTRDDAPHRLAFDVADRIVAPWPQGFHDTTVFGAAAPRLRTVGGISRHAGRARAAVVPGSVLLLGGIGAPSDRAAVWESLVAGSPGTAWSSAGFLPGTFVADPWDAICSAELVVSAAGQNSVADVAAAGRPLVLVPQERPFGEQRTTATALDRAGLAVLLDGWPDAAALDDAIARTLDRPTRWSEWGTDDAARDAGTLIADAVR
jgi:hypothetical protein